MTTVRSQPRTALDPLQRAAVESPPGPTVILGGPGTGKTHTLIARIARLIQSGVSPYHITYLSFSSRNAEDTRRIIEKRTDTAEHAPHIFVGTFHMYCSQFLRRAGAREINLASHFTLWDRIQSVEVLQEMLDAMTREMEEKNANPRERKSGGIRKIGADQIDQILNWHSNNLGRRRNDRIPARYPSWDSIIDLYEAEKHRQNAMDLDDLIPGAIRAMQLNPALQSTWKNSRSRHLFIDEYQDITPVQYELIKLISGAKQYVTIAADPNQSIYAFRNADPQLIRQFVLDHEKVTQHLLQVNHRSSATLTRMITTLTTSPQLKGLQHDHQRAIRPEGPKPELYHFDQSPRAMDTHLVYHALNLIEEGYAWEDMACIYRQKTTNDRLEYALTNMDIPFHTLGDDRREKQSYARAITSLMASILNPTDVKSFAQAACYTQSGQPRSLNIETVRNIRNYAINHQVNAVESAQALLEEYRPETPIHNNLINGINTWLEISEMLNREDILLYDLCHRAATIYQQTQHNPHIIDNPEVARLLALAQSTPRLEREPNREYLARFLELIATAPYHQYRSLENDDPFDPRHGITLSTIHGAKGLQWKIVWLVDAADHIMPGERSAKESNNDSALHQEQRIFYVASTRATNRLFYYYSTRSGSDRQAVPCRFIDALGDTINQYSVTAPPQAKEI